MVRNCVSGSWSKQIVTPDKKWFSRSVQLEVFMDRSAGATVAKYLSLCTVVMKQMRPLENTNRKAAEKLSENYSYHAQGYQLDFNSCYLQLRQSLMLRQAVEEPSLRDS